MTAARDSDRATSSMPRVAVVTGGASGIGLAIARRLGARPGPIIIADIDRDAAKAALVALTRQIAVEVATDGITANAICPGPVDTPLTRVLHSEQFRGEYTRAIPMSRYGAPGEIAFAVAFLASDEASYITGIALPVDGGFLAAGERPD